MDGQEEEEKVYVAVGNDLQDGIGALEWAIKKWSSPSISIVILHVNNSLSKDFVYTPFGKLPASAVSDEKLEVLRKFEQEKNDKLLSEYLAFCGQVKADVLKVEKNDKPINKAMIDLILELRITKLVMGITFMKSSSGKSKNVISGSFYVHRNKPDYCELFIICGGKLVFLKEENDGFMEDDQGVMVGRLREKASFKGWIEKLFNENPNNFYLINGDGRNPSIPSTSIGSPEMQNRWENHVQELEKYFQELLSLDLDGRDFELNDEEQICSADSDVPSNADSNKPAEKIEAVKVKINEIRGRIELNKKEAKENVARHARAEWAICLCTQRSKELEIRTEDEKSSRADIQKDLEAATEQNYEAIKDIEENKSRLNAILELQKELSNKLHISSLAKTRAESQLDKAVIARAEMVREIEELRRQRDVLHRRIEFCREKDAIGMVTKLSELGRCSYREYTSEEIRLATDGFSERLRLKCSGDWTKVYRGRMTHATVAIKMVDGISDEDFQAKMKFLSNIRHRHVVAMIGFCSELKCIIYEYMHNGCLRDALFSSHRKSGRKNRDLSWPNRIRIASEICSGLSFLHMAEPRPIIHRNLNPSTILLDRNLVAKIHSFELNPAQNEHDWRADLHAFGVLVLQLLTGRNWAGLVDEAQVINRTALIGVLDRMAGEWPLDLAEKLATIALMCLSSNQEVNTGLRMADVAQEVENVRRIAADLEKEGKCTVVIEEGSIIEEMSDVPNVLLCPIFQEVMKNPHVAADGFSYEQEAIEEWLKMGHDTSPMTNLKLKHNHLTPNHTLRSLIQDWHKRRSIPTP